MQKFSACPLHIFFLTTRKMKNWSIFLWTWGPSWETVIHGPSVQKASSWVQVVCANNLKCLNMIVAMFVMYMWGRMKWKQRKGTTEAYESVEEMIVSTGRSRDGTRSHRLSETWQKDWHGKEGYTQGFNFRDWSSHFSLVKKLWELASVCDISLFDGA